MIKKTTRTMPLGNTRTPVTAGTSITSGVRNRQAQRPVNASFNNLTPSQRAFARQLQNNARRSSAVMAATNTSNIMARPDFIELLPMFVQKLLILDVYGSVAMKSRQQLVPYFKFIAENTKGETKAGQIINSPFMNRQGIDPNFTGRVVKNEELDGAFLYTPVLPGSASIRIEKAGGTVKTITDNGDGTMSDGSTINYATGLVTLQDFNDEDKAYATYQYDNETVGPDAGGQYGAKMAKGY